MCHGGHKSQKARHKTLTASTGEPHLSQPCYQGVDTSANPSTLRPNPRARHHVGAGEQSGQLKVSSACFSSVCPQTWDWGKEDSILGVQTG